MADLHSGLNPEGLNHHLLVVQPGNVELVLAAKCGCLVSVGLNIPFCRWRGCRLVSGSLGSRILSPPFPFALACESLGSFPPTANHAIASYMRIFCSVLYIDHHHHCDLERSCCLRFRPQRGSREAVSR